MGAPHIATMAAVLLALTTPQAFAQGSQGGRGSSNRQPSDAGPRERDAISHVGGATPRHETRPQEPPPQRTLWSDNANRGLSPFSGSGPVRGGLNSPRPGVDAFRARPDTYSAQRDRRADRTDDGRNGRRRGRSYPAIRGAYYLPTYSYGLYSATPAVAPPTEATTRSAPAGFLRLLVTPRRADVIVDGIYEGTADDFGGTGERALPSGVHRVRLETEGYEPVEFDVRIPDNDTITLRRDLYPRSVAPPPPLATAPTAAPAQAPKVIYAIPRCYLGDTRPRPDQLPAGCNIADLRTLN